ncbi:hypothetical protein AOLI_G00002430 [Acnodon oligacanthus]
MATETLNVERQPVTVQSFKIGDGVEKGADSARPPIRPERRREKVPQHPQHLELWRRQLREGERHLRGPGRRSSQRRCSPRGAAEQSISAGFKECLFPFGSPTSRERKSMRKSQKISHLQQGWSRVHTAFRPKKVSICPGVDCAKTLHFDRTAIRFKYQQWRSDNHTGAWGACRAWLRVEKISCVY